MQCSATAWRTYESMPLKTLQHNVLPEQAGRVDGVVRTMTELSHSQVRGLFDHDCVTIDDEPCGDGGAIVNAGEEVAVRYDPNQRYREKKIKRWDDRTFTIVHEDNDLIVVDKAAGTLTVPTDHDEPNTLVERVGIYLSHSKRKREAFVVHRLDREVSGLLVFGKSEAVAQHLIEQFKHKKPERLYAAIVAGVMPDDTGTFDEYLATGNNLDRYVTGPSKKSERAVTHYRVLARLVDATHVEAKLETGKRNQIRVHFAHAGYPVLGDPRYEPEKANHARWIRKRIALHARTLSLVHPVTGNPLHCESPLPAAMAKFLRSV